MTDRISELEAELKAEKRESANWHEETRRMILERDLWRGLAERMAKALKNIIGYGQALQPGPVHPVTFNACAIAYKALKDFETARKGK